MATRIQESERIQRLQQRSAGVRREVSGLTTEVEGAIGDFERFVRTQLDRRPYATLGAATGLGYVLGGGLPTRLGRVLFGMGGRLALLMMAQRFTTGLAGPQEEKQG